MEQFKILVFHTIFSENAFCLSKRLGIDVLNDFKAQDGITYLVFGAHDQAVNLFSIQRQNKNIKYIIINTEPPQSNHLKNKYFLTLMKENIVWDYHDLSKKYLESLDIRVYSMYFPEFVYTPVETPRPIDILFVGSKNERRISLERKLREKYPNKRIEFHMEWKHADQSEMRKLLQSAKVVLNVPYYDSNILETHRIHFGLACGCEVVSLYSGHEVIDKFYEPFVHFHHDLFEYFDGVDMLPADMTEQKKKYPELISALMPLVKHNKWLLEQLIQV
jgi:hypothetical protein